MTCDLSWLVGLTLIEVHRHGPVAWQFRFGPDAEVKSESPWRIIRDGRIALCSGDHGQQYGLSKPVDAEAECRSLIGGAAVRSATVHEESRDLVVGFEPGFRLEIIPLSSGYESWQVYGPDGLHIVAVGGGELAVWGPKTKKRTVILAQPDGLTLSLTIDGDVLFARLSGCGLVAAASAAADRPALLQFFENAASLTAPARGRWEYKSFDDAVVLHARPDEDGGVLLAVDILASSRDAADWRTNGTLVIQTDVWLAATRQAADVCG